MTSATIPNGTPLGARFTVTRALGSGSFGHTYLAHDSVRQGPVAIKLFDPLGTGDWKAHELFEREASVLRSLRHHGVPEIYDTTEVDWQNRTLPVLVMEFIDGSSLAQLIESRRSHELSDVMRMLVDLLGVLEYLHERVPPVLHRDIKPANVILRPNGSPVLVDFGSVRQVFRNADETGSTIAGTYGYMPYEQYMGQAGPASDIFSLGATMVHLLTGRPPKDFMDADGRIVLPETLSSSVVLQRVLARMLKASPQERFQSARATRDALLTPSSVQLPLPVAAGNQPVAMPTHASTDSHTTTSAVVAAPIPAELQEAAPRAMNRPLRALLKKIAPTMFDYMDTTLKRTDETSFGSGVAVVFVSLVTLGVYPASFMAIANARRRKLRRFLRAGTPTTARIHRIDSEETAFRERVARVHYEFEVNGIKHRDSDQVMPLIAGRWEVNHYVPILYIATVPYDSVIVVEMQ